MSGEAIAIVGMAGRFPGAPDVEAFWRNLCAGVESITRYSRAELEAAGVDPALLADPRYVPASGGLSDVELFDASFFGFSPREAELMDPQHRLFLECSWEALEDAGYDTASYRGSIGIFGGMSMSKYLLNNLLPHRDLLAAAGPLQVRIFNDKDFLVSLAAFKLGLTGPSVTVQTACSTSLVAVCLACHVLLAYECDMALAGGVSIAVPHRAGYLPHEGVTSPDGHCRAFDAAAQGTVEGNGVGVIVLKRLADALEAGDTIHGVIRGFATNNDGSLKLGYTAPSIEGQLQVIAMAQAVAGIEPETITCIEAHGTGTHLGDPIEVAALTEVFSAGTNRKGFCALGSVKTNIGHLDAAAGVAGLIKAVLAVERAVLPPSLHFTTPNPQIDFAATPFYVNTEARPWRAGGPRRAGVSSFAIGGVNAHVIVEEPPAPAPASPAAPWQLLLLSARTETALARATDRLARHLESHSELELADVAYTLKLGRRTFSERCFAVCRDREDAIAVLDGAHPARFVTGLDGGELRQRPVAFLFGGQGSQHLGMGRQLYAEMPAFRREIDRCADLLAPRLGFDLREAIYPAADTAEAAARVDRTSVAQPALFAIELALARLWMEWGIRPAAMLGHSIGEYVAACLAGVLSLESALAVVAARGRLMEELPAGAMLAVSLAASELEPLLGRDLDVAALNEPGGAVVSGSEPAVAALAERLADGVIPFRRLHTSHAFHSRAVEPMLGRFAAELARVELRQPELPWVSNVTGTWITAEQATDPLYWVEHARRTVRFADGLTTLLADPEAILLEVGPGNSLARLAQRQAPGRQAIPSMRHPLDRAEDREVLLAALGRLWLAGLPLDGEALYAGERRRRVPLPAYPFERRRYWIEPGRPVSTAAEAAVEAAPPVRTERTVHTRPKLSSVYAEPRTATERAVAAIWQEVLGVEPVGRDDDFFDLGGHSLLGTRVLSRLRQHFGVDLSIRTLFEARTVAALACELPAAQAAPRAADGRDTIPRRSRESNVVFPVSFAQERLWFLDQLMPGSPLYNEPKAVHIAGRLDVAALARSLAEIVRRHEVLRTTFEFRDGRPVQVIGKADDFALPLADLQSLPECQRTAEAGALASRVARQPFDLTRGPLLRVHLIRQQGEEHLLLLNLHHIASDGWSMGVLVRELGALYDTFSRGLPAPLPELPVQYADYAVWQRERLPAILAEHLGFWREELAGAPNALELPADRLRPPAPTGRGDHLTFTLGPALTSGLTTLARSVDATSFMVLLTAFQALLHSLSGQEDVLVGSPVANRDRPEIEGLIGFFVNTLVLRGRLGTGERGEPSFIELVERVRASTLSAFAHQEVPFEKLVEELQPERDLSRAPLFQVAFTLQNAPAASIELPGLTLEPLDLQTGTAKFDLRLDLEERGGVLHGMLEYSTDLFDAATAKRWAGGFEALLASAVADPGRRLSQMPLLGEAERHQLLGEWNDTADDLPAKAVDELIGAQAERTPDAVAVVCRSAALSYGDLDCRAGRLARRLRFIGVGPDVPVGLCTERSPLLLVGLLAILKARGAYVPLDPAYPEERLAFMVRDAGVSLVVADRGLSGRAALQGIACVSLDETDEGEVAPAHPALPESLAYVIYTSGSTGRPKGVQISHRALGNLLASMRRRPGLTAGDVLLAVTTLSFDIAALELFLPLLVGAKVVLATREEAADGALLSELLVTSGATVLQATPATWRLLLEAGLPRNRRLVAICGGEALSEELAAELLPRVGELWNVYGPTETTVWSAARKVVQGRPASDIGRPIANTRFYLLGPHLEPVPLGAPGELCIGGAGLTRGYRARPEQTALALMPDPYAPEAGARLYRSGDLARLLPGGGLRFLGRIDQQVKVRGFRIEPGEIESALSAHPGVRQTVVVVRGDRPEERRLVAYLVPAAGQPPAVGELRELLARRLPEYMVPSAFVMLPELPLTPNRKVDRRALPAPDLGEAAGSDAEPRTPIEQLLANLCADLLGIERVPVDASFFDLGGHSLMAARLVARVREVFAVELPVREVFAAPTVAGLAARVAAARGVGVRPMPPIERVPRGGELPLSFAQERLWFLDQLAPGAAVYNIPAALRCTGRLSVSSLAATLHALARRHETLRTAFRNSAGRPVQIIHEEPALPLQVIDLSACPEAVRNRELDRLRRNAAVQPFDLAEPPLARVVLVVLGGNESVLLVTLHHIVSDGWSLGVFVREVAALYGLLAAGLPAALPELPLQYSDFACWQRRWLQGEELDEHLAFWRETLSGAPAALELPSDRPRPAVASLRGAITPLRLPAQLAGRIAALARSLGGTPFMALLAVFQTLLSRYGGQDDVLVGSPVANRDRVEVESLIGLFVNTLVLRGDLGGDPPFAELLARTRSRVLAAFEHRELPFEKLVEELAPVRDLSRNPLFQAMLALQNVPGFALELPDLALEPLPPYSSGARFDLSLILEEGPDGLTGALEYSTDLFEASTVQRLVGHFESLLGAAVSEPGLRLSELPLLAEPERHQLAVEWNDTGVASAPDLCLHELFEAQAARCPDAEALVGEGLHLSYGELEARANQLAWRLRELGVCPEDRVGVRLGRSPDLVVALLAVLKAGGAYVPLDPRYPQERLALMLSDSRPRVVIEAGAGAAVEGVQVLDLERERQKLARWPAGSLPRESEGGHLAYLIYTSGSTGRPKAVAIEHRSAVALVCWAAKVFTADELEGVLFSTSAAFDLSVFELFVPLSLGGRVILADNALELTRLAAASRVRLINTVPSAMAELVRSGGLPGSVRTVNLAGEPIPPSLAEALSQIPTVERVLNLYGPSEDTTYSTWSELPRDLRSAPPIGRPIDGTRVHVLGCHGETVPAGVAGELFLCGSGLARGYLGRPDLTAERFVPDRFAAQPGSRLYRTGDRVRFQVDGQLEYLGRIDHQVKVRGFRIEPGEIEAALVSHPGIREAVVVARGMGADRRLVGYVLAQPDNRIHPQALRSYLAERLPDYMVPQALMVLESWPLTPSGKLDRNALPSPSDPGPEGAADAAPLAPIEEVLAGIWAEALDVPMEAIGSDENFFHLGGHSLLATRVVSRLREALRVELPVRDLFETPTLAALAARVVRAMGAGVAIDAPQIQPIPRNGPLPLSYAQERLWFLHQLEPDSSAYNVPTAVRLTGRLDPSALARALSEIVRRHETLRTTFAMLDTGPVQVIGPPIAMELPVVDLAALPSETREAEARRLVAADVRRPFDLTGGPPIRAALIRLAEEDHIALLTLHHIVTDAWSMRVLVRELATFYAGFSRGEPSPWSDLAIQYADFALWQRSWLRNETLERQLAYWTQSLAGAPQRLELPTDRPRLPRSRPQGGRARRTFSDVSARDLEALGRKHGATLFMVLLAGFEVLVHWITGQRDFIIGTDIANRTRREIEGVIGFFVNQLALRADLVDDLAFGDLVVRVRESTLAAYEYAEVPFERVVERMRPERHLGFSPLFQIKLNQPNFPEPAVELPGLTCTALAVEPGAAKLDLLVDVFKRGDELGVVCNYNADLFDPASIDNLLVRFEAMLAAAAARPETTIAELCAALIQADRKEWIARRALLRDKRRAATLVNEQRPAGPCAGSAKEVL